MAKPTYYDTNDLPLEVIAMLRDYVQIKNLLNGDTCHIGEEQPVASRLLRFMGKAVPHSAFTFSHYWESFNNGKGRL